MQDNECADGTMNALAAVSHPSHLFLEFWVLRRQNVDFMYDIVVVCPLLIVFTLLGRPIMWCTPILLCVGGAANP